MAKTKTKRPPCKMISFDTSSTDTGWAVYINGKLKRYGDFNHKDIKNDTEKRIASMCKDIATLILKEKPDILIAEDLNVMKSVSTAKTLAEIIGGVRMCKYLITDKDIWFDKMPPKHWRKLVGDANEKIPTKSDDCKVWDIAKVEQIFKIKTDNDNIADAILIGYAYIMEFV